MRIRKKHYPVSAPHDWYRCMVCPFTSDRVMAATVHARLIHGIGGES